MKFSFRRLVLFFSLFLLILMVLKTQSPLNPRFKRQAVKTTIGTREDPDGRAKWEHLRLQDPKTGKIPTNIRREELEFARTLPTRPSRLSTSQSSSHHTNQSLVFSWKRRGPFNVGGRTRALALDVNDENIVLAGGVSGGLWRSPDGGVSWTKLTFYNDLHSVTAIAQDTCAGKTNCWYYGTGEYCGNSASGGGSAEYFGDGIFKSTDNGFTWHQLEATKDNPDFKYVWNIVTNSTNESEDEILAATYHGIFRSIDGGETWTVVLGGQSPYSNYTDIAISPTGVLYATLSSQGSQKGIWRSADGVSWELLTPMNWPAVYKRVVIGIAPSNENTVYFLAETPGSGLNNHSLWKYTRQSSSGFGTTGQWTNRSANLPAYGGYVGDFESQGSYDLIVKVKPDNENVVFIGGTNLYRSIDGFASRSKTTWIGGYSTANNASIYYNHHPDQHALVFLPSNPNILLSGHDGGLSKTTNNLAGTVNWTSLNNGYFTTQFYTIALDHSTSGNPIIIGGMQDNGTWFANADDDSVEWIDIFSGDGSYCSIASNRSSYYVSAQYAIIYRMLLDENGHLSRWTRVDPTGGSGYLFVNPFVLDPNNTNRMYLAGGYRLWRNDDLTRIPYYSNSTTTVNWTSLNNTASPGGRITALAISTTPVNIIYYGTSNGRIFRLNNAHLNYSNPIDIWSGKGLPEYAYVSCLAVDPSDANRVLLIFSNYHVPSLFYTEDGGTTWSDVSGNLEVNPDGSGPGPSTRWAEILPFNGTTYYLLGTSTGLYSTTDINGAATEWIQEGAQNIGNVVVDMIDTRLNDGMIVVGTHGNGVFSAEFTQSIDPLKPPSDLTAVVSGDTVELNWKAPELHQLSSSSNSGGSARSQIQSQSTYSFSAPFNPVEIPKNLKGYHIYRSTLSPVQIISGNKIGTVAADQTGYQDTDVLAPATYYYAVTAVYNQGESAPSNEVAASVENATNTCTEELKFDDNHFELLYGLNAPGILANGPFVPSNYPARLIAARFVAGDSTGADSVNIKIYIDPTGSAMQPAPALLVKTVGPFKIEANGQWQEVALNISLPHGSHFFLGVEQRTGEPCGLGFDLNAPVGNAFFAFNNEAFNTFRSAGVFALRAIVEMRQPAENETQSTGEFQQTATFESTDIKILNKNNRPEFTEWNGAALPTAFSLSQNYPNPFNPSTSIRFALPEATYVKITVYSVLGEKIKTLIHSLLPAGNHSIQFQAENISSGVYFYVMETPRFKAMNKMLVIK